MVGDPCIGQHSGHAYPCKNGEGLFITDPDKHLSPSLPFPFSYLFHGTIDNPADVFLSCCSSLSITMMKKVGESTDPCCTPRDTANGDDRSDSDLTTAV